MNQLTWGRKGLRMFFAIQVLLDLLGLGATTFIDWQFRGWIWAMLGAFSVAAYMVLLAIQAFSDAPTTPVGGGAMSMYGVNAVPMLVGTVYFVVVTAILAIFISVALVLVAWVPGTVRINFRAQNICEGLGYGYLLLYDLLVLWKIRQ